MMADHATSQNAELTARPSRTGKVVVVCVCLLATAGAFLLSYVTTDHSLNPKQRLAMEQIRRMEGFFKVYHRTMGRFPEQEEGFKPLIDGKVIASVPVDPWGRPYVYLFNNEYTGVMSYGADGKPGGQGEDTDISSGGLRTRR
jgi:general secretion pathway protein G